MNTMDISFFKIFFYLSLIKHSQINNRPRKILNFENPKTNFFYNFGG